MATLEQAKQQLAQAKQQVQERREEADKVNTQLMSVQESLPDVTSRQALTKYGGLSGRQKRQEVASVQEDISQRQQSVEDYKKQLQEYEQGALAQTESNIKDVEAQQQAVRTIEQAIANDKVYLYARFGEGYEKQYAQEYLKRQKLDKENLYRDIETKKKELGVSELSIPQYNLVVKDFNDRVQGLPTVKLPDLPRATVRDVPIPAASSYSPRPSTKLMSTKLMTPVPPNFSTPSGAIYIPTTIKVKQSSQIMTPAPYETLYKIRQSQIPDKSKGTYLPNYNVFIKDSPNMGGRGTAIITPATYGEQRYYDKNRGVFGRFITGGAEYKSDNILSIPRNQLKERYNKAIQTDTPDMIGVGSIVKASDRDIRDFRYLISDNPVAMFGGAIALTGEVIGETTGNIASKYLPEKGLFSITTPAQELKVALPYQTKGTSLNVGEGYFAPKTNIDIPESEAQFFTSKQGKGVGYFVGRSSIYMNPLGLSIAVAEQTGKLTGEIDLAGRDVKAGSIGYAKRYGVEGGILAGYGFFKIGQYGLGKIKSTKYSKYFEPASLRVEERTSQNLLITDEAIPRKQPSLNIVDIPEQGIRGVESKSKIKGATQVSESYPTGTELIKIKETRWLGGLTRDTEGIKKNLPISELKGVIKKLETFEGSAIKTPTSYFEEIDFGKVKRVTKVKDGEGIITLYDKKGNTILAKNIIQKSSSPIKLSSSQPSQIKVKIDSGYNPDYNVLEYKGKRYIKDGEGNQVYGVEPSLTSSRVMGEINILNVKGGSPKEKILTFKEEVSGFSDVISVTPTKAKIIGTTPEGKIVVKKQKSVNIEFGEDINPDVSMVLRRDNRQISGKVIKPNVDRSISEINQYKTVVVTGTEKQLFEFSKKYKPSTGKDLDQFAYLKDAEQKIDLLKKTKSAKSKAGKENTILQTTDGQQVTKTSSSSGGFPSDIELPDTIYVSPRTTMTQNVLPIQSTAEPLVFDIINARVNVPKISQRVNRLVGSNVQVATKTIDSQLMSVATKQSEILKTTATPSNKNIPLLKRLASQLPKEETKLRFDTKQIPKENILFKTAQKISSRGRTRTKTTTSTRETKTPNKIITADTSESFVGKLAKKIDEPNFFSVFTRKAGKEIKVGTFRSQEEAEGSLFKILKGSLRASGKIKQGEKTLSFGELSKFRGIEFGQSKRERGRVVQKKSFRLGSRSETKEIQLFKKSSGIGKLSGFL